MTTVRSEEQRLAEPLTAPAEASGVAGSPARWRLGLERFRRVTSSGQFIPQIDGLRFVAIGLVYVYHLRSYLREAAPPFADAAEQGTAVLRHGHYGVQLFFVISGFILALPFASHQIAGTKAVSLRAYFLRRLTRLEPPYILSMLLFFALLVVYVGQDARLAARHLGASLLYVHNVVFGRGSTINPVAWSLEVEIQFYLLVPVLARLFAIRATAARRAIVIGLTLVTVVAQTLAGPGAQEWLRLSVLGQLQFFLVGFLLADIYLTEWQSAPRGDGWWDLVSLAGWPLLIVAWEHEALARWVFPPLVLALYAAAFRGRWSRQLFANPWITTIGGMCYTIYLLHYQIISFVGRRTVGIRLTSTFSLELLWQFLLITPVVLAVCATYFALIEKPCMRSDWPRRLVARARTWTPARSTA